MFVINSKISVLVNPLQHHQPSLLNEFGAVCAASLKRRKNYDSIKSILYDFIGKLYDDFGKKVDDFGKKLTISGKCPIET